MSMVRAFLFAFCVCFLLGSWQGWQERQNTTDEDFLAETAIGHMQVNSELAQTNAARGSVEYVCNSTSYFTYNIRKGDQRENTHPQTPASILSLEGLERVFEGATGLKLFELSRAGLAADAEGAAKVYEYRKTVAMVVGAISGYFAGRYLTARQRVPCDSPVLIAKLRDASSPFTTRVRRDFFRRRIEGLILHVDKKAFRVVDIQDKIAPPNASDDYVQYYLLSYKQDDTSFIAKELSWLRERLSVTNYHPTGQEYLMAWTLPELMARRLAWDPKFFSPQFPGAHTFQVWYDGPYDPNDTLASFSHADLFSRNFMRFILYLSLCAVSLFLLVAVIVGVTEKNQRKRTVLLP